MDATSTKSLKPATGREVTKAPPPKVVPKDEPPKSETLFGRLRDAAGAHGEKAIAEIPATLKKLRLLMTVAAVALPLFLIGVIVILAMALLHVRF